MSELRDNYGKFIKLYDGEGNLIHQACEFQIGQLSDGQVVVFCPFLGDPPRVKRNEFELTGLTDDGKEVFAKGIVRQKQTIHPGLEDSYFECFYESLRPFELTVGTPDWSRAHSVTFSITNFLFCGNDANSGGRGTCYNAINFRLDGLDISIAKVADYESLVDAVDRGEQTEVTCKLTVEVGGRSRDDVRKIANRICDLLTIAKGRKISWISYRVLGANSSELFRFHENRLTDRKNGFELIDFRQPARTIDYMERGYSAHKRFDIDCPALLNGVASLIVDSNANRFTLSRALIMFSIVDALGKNVLDHKHRSKGQTPPDRYSTDEKINVLVTTFHACVSTDEVEYFRLSRNSVVHELKFHTNDTVKEYQTCYHIFHRLLLRILDYQAVYFDITLPGRFGFGTSFLHTCP